MIVLNKKEMASLKKTMVYFEKKLKPIITNKRKFEIACLWATRKSERLTEYEIASFLDRMELCNDLIEFDLTARRKEYFTALLEMIETRKKKMHKNPSEDDEMGFSQMNRFKQ